MENTIDKDYKLRRYFFQHRNSTDWLWALLNVISVIYALSQYHMLMDEYEKAIILCTGLALVGFGWFWQAGVDSRVCCSLGCCVAAEQALALCERRHVGWFCSWFGCWNCPDLWPLANGLLGQFQPDGSLPLQKF